MVKLRAGKVLLATTALVLATACLNDTDNDSTVVSADAPADAIEMSQTSDNTQNISEDIELLSEAVTDAATNSTVRTADAHTHGDAALAVVLEGNLVTVELDTPLYNLLGFEHAPETEAQKLRVEQAEGQLQYGKHLFTFNDVAECSRISELGSITLFDAEHDEHDHASHDSDHDDHNEENHDQDEVADSHDRAEHADHDDATHDETHKDVVLQYEFRCQNPSSLTNVTVNLFELFDELSEVELTYLGPSTQKQAKLTPNNAQMDLTQ